MSGTHRVAWALAPVIALLAGIAQGEEIIQVARFSTGDRGDWKVRSFEGETTYTFDAVDGHRGLRAWSNGTASGLYRKIQVNLDRTPYLEWSWRIDNVLEGVDERTRGGDDYPARVYVVVSGGLAFWRTRSLVYVWSSNQPIGSTWDNAFTGNAKVMALCSGMTDAGRWVGERRDLWADFRKLFGEEVDAIDAVAIMTDTDNSGGSVVAWYGDIRMVSD